LILFEESKNIYTPTVSRPCQAEGRGFEFHRPL
jgi:hypothetical protein